MRTFFIQTLGCKVNQYESDQLAALLRARGLVEAGDATGAHLRIVNTCSVTSAAAAKSRQSARRAIRLPLLQHSDGNAAAHGGCQDPGPSAGGGAVPTAIPIITGSESSHGSTATDDRGFGCGSGLEHQAPIPHGTGRARVIVTGCWATGEPEAAAKLPGVDAVIGHHDDVATELDRLLGLWRGEQDGLGHGGGRKTNGPLRTTDPHAAGTTGPNTTQDTGPQTPPKSPGDEGWMIKAGTSVGNPDQRIKANRLPEVKGNQTAPRAIPDDVSPPRPARVGTGAGRTWFGRGTTSLPLLGQRQTGRQRAFLKVQDGCDAHCTYCIIPRLRPRLWSKPMADAVDEARRLVAAGHVELVLTGIFLGAYGQPTAMRRRQPRETAKPLGELVRALCEGVLGLRRLRLSSLEPGDLTPELVAVLKAHSQVVPHFHLPLQSGSDELLRRMNRQYGREEFLRMVDLVRGAFDRPALTTDVIVGFPGEAERDFARTLEVVDHAGFIHVHAFAYSPRPGTAAARWKGGPVAGVSVNERIDILRRRAEANSLAFRRQFVGETVEILIERDDDEGTESGAPRGGADFVLRHGRCERYFPVSVAALELRPGDFLRVRVDRVQSDATFGTVVGREEA